MDYSKMSLREKILQTFIVTIREVNKHGGTESFFENYPVGGLFFRYLPDMEGKAEMGTALSRERLAECRAASRLPLLVCADGVGFKDQSIGFDMRSLAGSQNKDDSYNIGKILGMQMNANDIDWILGPSVDMLYSRAMSMSAISDDPKITADIYSEVVKGIQDQGVLATVKHFPGLGTSIINMHCGPGKNTLSFEEWMDTYGYIYQEMINQGVYSVMTTHATLKSYDDARHDGYCPIATYSTKLTQELLKDKLGFEGAVVTDALVMGGMAIGNLVEETAQAFKCGADLLLWPPIEAADRIEEMIENGEIPMSRLEDALERIKKMRDFREKALSEHLYDTPDTAFAEQKFVEITNRGIHLLKNEKQLLPIRKGEYNKVLIIDASKEANHEGANILKEELQKRNIAADVKRDIYDVPSNVCWQDDIDELQKAYDLIIFHVWANYFETWGEELMLTWASHMFDKKKTIIVDYGNPYYAHDYFAEECTVIQVNSTPTDISVRAVAKRILGEEEFTGNSPLNNVN